MEKIDGKGIISLVKNDFIPLEESKEGLLKGGFGSVITRTVDPTPLSLDNCKCNSGKDNCPCPDSGCQVPRKGNNCYCGTTTTIPQKPPHSTSTNWLTGTGFAF